MNNNNKFLYEQALAAIEEVFSDSSTPLEKTKENLGDLLEVIKEMLEWLQEANQ